MEKNRIDKGIEIINYAIKNGVSTRAASLAFNYSGSYLKNTKAKVNEAYENDLLTTGDYFKFQNALNKYEQSKNGGVVNSTDVLEKTEVEEKESQKLDNQAKSDQIIVSGNDKSMNVESKTNTSYGGGHITSLKQLLDRANVDLDVWDVKDYVVNKWDVTSWKQGDPRTIENFQVKARLEKNQAKVNIKSAGEIFAEMTKKYKAPVESSILKNTEFYKENNLFEVNIFDLHMGKLAWAGETGENYDTKIARERFLYSIYMLMKRASSFEYKRILFPVGNDFFNSDTILNTTTGGTPQDEDLRWQKTFQVGVKLIVDGISALRTSGVPVDVMIIPGNHDFERSFYLGAFLEAWYRDDENVNVDNGASPRKYYHFGKVLLGLTHGNEEKEDSLPLLMATEKESKQYWSDTLFHEWHLGHVHRKKTVKYTIRDKNKVLAEDLGVTVRYLSSLTGTEEWHHRKGYIGQIKAANAFLWNSETGLIAELTSNYMIE